MLKDGRVVDESRLKGNPANLPPVTFTAEEKKKQEEIYADYIEIQKRFDKEKTERKWTIRIGLGLFALFIIVLFTFFQFLISDITKNRIKDDQKLLNFARDNVMSLTFKLLEDKTAGMTVGQSDKIKDRIKGLFNDACMDAYNIPSYTDWELKAEEIKKYTNNRNVIKIIISNKNGTNIGVTNIDNSESMIDKCPIKWYEPCNMDYITCTWGDREEVYVKNWKSIGGESTGKKIETHKAIDIGVKYVKLLAPADGVVELAGWYSKNDLLKDENNNYRDLNLLGNLMLIDHGSGYETLCGHLESVCVKEGQRVTNGQLLGITGSTGHSTAPHLHFAMSYYKKPFNPERMIFHKRRV